MENKNTMMDLCPGISSKYVRQEQIAYCAVIKINGIAKHDGTYI